MNSFGGRPPESDDDFAAGWVSGFGSAVLLAGGVRLAQRVAGIESVGSAVAAFEQFVFQPRISVAGLAAIGVLVLLILAVITLLQYFGGVRA